MPKHSVAVAVHCADGESRVVGMVQMHRVIEKVGREESFADPFFQDLLWSSMCEWTTAVVAVAFLLFDVRLTNHPAFMWGDVSIHNRQFHQSTPKSTRIKTTTIKKLK